MLETARFKPRVLKAKLEICMPSLVFLPGASGSQQFWTPLLEALKPKHYQVMAYPGFDGIPASEKIQNLVDLQAHLTQTIVDDCILIAQSMGGVLAVGMALAQRPRVRALILIATSGGVATDTFGCIDWREKYANEFHQCPPWFIQDQTRYDTDQLQQINLPVLLLWGDQDPLSTVAVGEYLKTHLPLAELHVIHGAAHHLASTHAGEIAPMIQTFLAKVEQR